MNKKIRKTTILAGIFLMLAILPLGAQDTLKVSDRRSGKVEVTADVPLLQDLALAQRAALPQLARDAAAQILALAAQPEPPPAK